MSPTHSSPCILDPSAYPNILDQIIRHSDHKTRVALWGVNRALQAHLNTHFYRTVVAWCGGLGPEPRSHFPKINKPETCMSMNELFKNVENHCRTVDITSRCGAEPAFGPLVVDLAMSRGDPITLRAPDTVDLSEFDSIPETLVLNACIPRPSPDAMYWLQPGFLAPLGIPDGPERVVLNIAYTWPAQLFASEFGPEIGFTSFPYSVKEVVFHFKKVGPPNRPRYAVCESITDSDGDESDGDESGGDESDGHEGKDSIDDNTEASDDSGAGQFNNPGARGCKFVKAYYASSSPPTLTENQHLHIVPMLFPGQYSLFERIAKVYANSVGKGKRKHRPIKMTLVGLDEFDEARDDDFLVDALFEEIVEDLPWTTPPARDDWAHFDYPPVADRFMDEVLDHLDESKWDRVLSDLQLMSSKQYLAELGSRREEEDWWQEFKPVK